jgi:hypothetical protein
MGAVSTIGYGIIIQNTAARSGPSPMVHRLSPPGERDPIGGAVMLPQEVCWCSFPASS